MCVEGKGFFWGGSKCKGSHVLLIKAFFWNIFSKVLPFSWANRSFSEDCSLIPYLIHCQPDKTSFFDSCMKYVSAVYIFCEPPPPPA